MKLGIVVGHTNGAKGAHSPFLNASEYPWNKDLANLIVSNSPSSLQTKIFFRDGHGITGAYRDSDVWGSDVTVELHFNSSDNHRASGSGVLYHPNSTRGKRLATLLCQEIRTTLDLPAWPSGTSGVVTPFEASGAEQRGLASLSTGDAPATLIEPFFGSNADDSAKAAANKTALAKAIITAVGRF